MIIEPFTCKRCGAKEFALGLCAETDCSVAKVWIYSKTNGRHLLKMDTVEYNLLFRYPGFKGICIQSTNTKRAGRNPSLYPVIYGKDPQTGKPFVKQIHKVLIPYVPRGLVVDHINGDTFDNRRKNLEVVTRAENTRRAQITKKDREKWKHKSL